MSTTPAEIRAVTSGHRDHLRWPAGALGAWTTWIDRPEVVELRFGLALGWDSRSLRAAGAVRLRRPAPWPPLRFTFFVTATLTDLYDEAIAAVNLWADSSLDTVRELRLVEAGASKEAWKVALNRRNKAMLVDGRREPDGRLVSGVLASHLFAAWDGTPSGTGNTVGMAGDLGIPVVVPGQQEPRWRQGRAA